MTRPAMASTATSAMIRPYSTRPCARSRVMPNMWTISPSELMPEDVRDCLDSKEPRVPDPSAKRLCWQAMTVGHAFWPDQLTDSERNALQPGTPDGLPRDPDVLVVGGGIIGLATAAACVQANLGRVVLLERDTLGAGASGGAAGLLMPEAHVDTDPPKFVDRYRHALRASTGPPRRRWRPLPECRVRAARRVRGSPAHTRLLLPGR